MKISDNPTREEFITGILALIKIKRDIFKKAIRVVKTAERLNRRIYNLLRTNEGFNVDREMSKYYGECLDDYTCPLGLGSEELLYAELKEIDEKLWPSYKKLKKILRKELGNDNFEKKEYDHFGRIIEILDEEWEKNGIL